MNLPFAPFAYGRPGYGLPETRQVNFLVENTPGGPKTDTRLPRWCIEVAFSVGLGPVLGDFAKPGIFGGDVFTVSGAQLYRGTTLIGAVPIATTARFAASASAGSTQLVVVVGGRAYCYDGSTLAQIAIPDGQFVSDVCVAGSRFYFTIVASNVAYFSSLDDATAIDGLAFFTIDSSPSANLGLCPLGDEVAFFKEDSVEFWRQTGDQDAPLARTSGATYDKGALAQGAIVPIDNRILFVGSDRQVYSTDTGATRISTHAVEQDLGICATPEAVSSFKVCQDGHWIYVLNIPGLPTWAYDLANQQWGHWTSYGRPGFRARCGTVIGTKAYLGDDTSGQVFTFSATARTDAGDPVERVASCFAQAGGVPLACNELALECAVGVGPADDSECVVDMRYSDDKGQTWTSWRPRSLGRVGRYSTRPTWKNLGTIKRNRIRVFEFRVTDPVLANLCSVEMR